MKNLPPLGGLRAFEATARLLSFKLAADELGVTPTALSLTERLDGESFVALALNSQALTSGLVKAEELETTIGSFSQRDLKSAAIALGRTSIG